MKCPFCGHPESRVIDSRGSEDAIRRRRECDSCGRRFTTYERVEEALLVVVKKDGSREPFDRAKLFSGLARATAKRNVSGEELEALIARIEGRIRNSLSNEVPSQELGEMILDELRSLDEVAYVRFASVYREFQDVEHFARELDRLSRRGKKATQG